jgi:hypothetical protein
MGSERDARASGRIGGLTAWARNDRETMVGPAHRGFRRKFETEVDPRGELDPTERAVRADRLRRAWRLTLAGRSASVRRARRTESLNELEEPDLDRAGTESHSNDVPSLTRTHPDE